MIRNIQLKLVIILVLLILSVMIVTGTYLISSVGAYYERSFQDQMTAVFTPAFIGKLQSEGAPEDGAAAMRDLLTAYSDKLGLSDRRKLYVLDRKSAEYLAGTDDAGGAGLEITENILRAMNENAAGQGNGMADRYFDAAVPVLSGERSYIVYVRDNRQEVDELLLMLFVIIVQAMFFGLVISVVLSFLLSKTLSRPIESITEGVKRVADGEFGSKLEVYSNDEIGTLTVSFNNMADILKNTLETVENERNKLSTLFLHMTDGVIAFDASGAILHMNPAAENMLGCCFSDGKCYDALLGHLQIPLAEVLSLTRPAHILRQAETAGQTLDFYLASFGRENEGGVLVVVHDVTEQHKLEMARREFVANVSHELRTPLTNIKSYAETLMDDPGVPEDLRAQFLRVILNESDRMTRIVQDLLTISRLDYGKVDWSYSTFSLASLLSVLHETFTIEAGRHGHTLTLDIQNTLPSFYGDRGRIEQVLVNILTNAIKYTPDGGHIATTARYDGERIHIRIKDDGIGIPKEDVPRLFDRFYRVDKARSRDKGGSGLGLSIAREIVTHHGGEITVESEPDRGTAVTLTLPVILPESSAEDPV